MRALGWWAWRMVRPVARPLSWRMRGFLTRDLHAELAQIRHQQDLLMQHITLTRAPHADGGPGSFAAVDPRLLAAMESALLTLALEAKA